MHKLKFIEHMSSDIIEKIRIYFAKKPVLKAWLFGSHSRGEETASSDIDILVEFDPKAGVSLLDHVGMQLDLEDMLRCAVDLVTAGSVFPWLKQSIDNDKILIYERKTA